MTRPRGGNDADSKWQRIFAHGVWVIMTSMLNSADSSMNDKPTVLNQDQRQALLLYWEKRTEQRRGHFEEYMQNDVIVWLFSKA